MSPIAQAAVLPDAVRVLGGDGVAVFDHPLAGCMRGGMHLDVELEVHAVRMEVGQDARQPLVLDLALVLAGVVLLDGTDTVMPSRMTRNSTT